MRFDRETQEAKAPEFANYDTETGELIAPDSLPFESSYRPAEPLPPDAYRSGINPHQVATRGFAQMVGLAPAMAAVTVVADLMLHGADVVSAGLLIPLSAMSGVALGYITYKAQMKWGDDSESAKIKALIVALLTAIPSPLPYMLFVPAGLIGFFRKK